MIQVLIVDDSAVVRQQLKMILQSDPELTVAGEACDGHEAVALVRRLRPDVITMDIRMPHMDGLEAIRYIMAENPTPIVVVTGADLERETELRTQATRCGAVSVLKAPGRITAPDYPAMAGQLIWEVKLMSAVKVITRPMSRLGMKKVNDNPVMPPPAPITSIRDRKTKVIAIGSSTGGPAALYTLLAGFPADFSIPILIVQHISFGFVEGLAGWLAGGCQLQVKVAEHGDLLQPGMVYVAPDEAHMGVSAYGRIRLDKIDPVGGHRPSVSVLFDSVAQSYGPAAIGVILTGMGSDGAAGMKTLREKGGTTVAQDEASCVVFGMPKEAIALGAVQHIAPIDKIAQTVTSLCRAGQRS